MHCGSPELTEPKRSVFYGLVSMSGYINLLDNISPSCCWNSDWSLTIAYPVCIKTALFYGIVIRFVLFLQASRGLPATLLPANSATIIISVIRSIDLACWLKPKGDYLLEP